MLTVKRKWVPCCFCAQKSLSVSKNETNNNLPSLVRCLKEQTIRTANARRSFFQTIKKLRSLYYAMGLDSIARHICYNISMSDNERFVPTRRQFLTASGLAAAGALAAIKGPSILGGVMSRLAQHFPDTSPTSITPEIVREHPTEFGFATHVFVNPEEGNNMTVDMFKQNIDLLASKGQKWIRFNIWGSETASKTDTGYALNEENLAKYDEVIDYARSRGLDINLIGNTPEVLQDVPHEQYVQFTREYFESLAARYKGKIAVWQLFNEPDTREVRNYTWRSDISDQQLSQLQQIIQAANEGVKSADPAAKTSINMTASRTDRIGMDMRVLTALAPHVDILGFDYYAGKDEAKIARLPIEIDALHEQFPNHELAIPEIGVSTIDPNVTPADQGVYLGKALAALQKGKYNPRMVFVNTLTDELWLGKDGHWGILKADRTPKASFDSVISLMQPTATPTPTATPIT